MTIKLTTVLVHLYSIEEIVLHCIMKTGCTTSYSGADICVYVCVCVSSKSTGDQMGYSYKLTIA